MAGGLALALLLRRRNRTVSAALSAGVPVSLIPDLLEHEMRSGIAELRALSRDAGLLRLRAEVASLELDLTISRAASTHAIVVDLMRGRVAADSYAARWQKNARGDTPHDAASAANEATVGSVRRTAITESSEAFNAGRLDAARDSGADLYRRWDAQADACPVCAQQDGVIVAVGEPFPEGEPGSVHPNCVCDWELLSAEEAGYGQHLAA